MLALENRGKKDNRTVGILFWKICEELPDIAWFEAFQLLMKTFLESVSEKFLLSETELEALYETFLEALPAPLKNSLLLCS